MRKDTTSRNGIKGAYKTLEIRGLNLDRFLNHVKKQDIELYNVKKITNKKILVTVKFTDYQNFFAIADKMCYNVKEIKNSGISYPIYRLFSSFGLLLGLICFIIITYFANDLVFAIDFTGSGSIYKSRIKEFLNGAGVKEFTRFSKIDLNSLEDKVLAENNYLSFVSIKKHGNRLVVDAALSSDKTNTLSGNVYALYSDVNGVVESIKVYRGVPTVGVGDSVGDGDLLVSGDVEIKETTVKINVLCVVTIIADSSFEYFSYNEEDENAAQFFAEQTLKDREIISSSVQKSISDGGYLYTVNMKYRRVLIAG